MKELMLHELTLGSLFSGSGGFELGGIINGIKPVWASEIEKYPITVTKARMPWMKHLGDVTKINGAEIEPVNIITFGSPCQDLSVAGKRAGIFDGERSNLFFEAIRIIKEMRDAHGVSGSDGHNGDARNIARWAVWENVPGALSSNKGEDFRCVLQAFCDIAEQGITVPPPPKGRWTNAGSIVGDGFSVAWRIIDLQYFGTATKSAPQRRRRIYLIADFGGECAGEVLLECSSLQWDSSESQQAWEDFTDSSLGSFERSCRERGWM